MSVAIRLSRAGRVHLPYYHIRVYNSRTRRDGRPVEELGFYAPESTKEPVRLDLERAKYWLSVGAKPSSTVASILKRHGLKASAWTPKLAKAEKLAAAQPSEKKEKKKAAPAPAKPATAKKKAKPAAKKAADADKVAKPAGRKARTRNSKIRGEKARKSNAS